MKKDFCSRCGRSRFIVLMGYDEQVCQACLTKEEKDAQTLLGFIEKDADKKFKECCDFKLVQSKEKE